MTKIKRLYIGRVGGVCVYVGQGEEGRHLHLNSGTSHIYEANRLHFLGEAVDVEVLDGYYSKEDALVFERQLISELSPAWNVASTNTISVRKELNLLVREHLWDKSSNRCLFLTDVAKRVQPDRSLFLKSSLCLCSPVHIHTPWKNGNKFYNEIIEESVMLEKGTYSMILSEDFLRMPGKYYRKAGKQKENK